MKRNSRLSLALHTLSHMAAEPERMRTSEEIAGHVSTNPVVVRRVLGELKKSGLLKSEKGHAGGWCLGRNPQEVTLADIYLALGERLVSGGERIGHSQCEIENNLYEKISAILGKLEKDLIQQLGEIDISKICEDK